MYEMKSGKWSNEASQDPSRGDLFQGNAFAQHRAPRSVTFPTPAGPRRSPAIQRLAKPGALASPLC